MPTTKKPKPKSPTAGNKKSRNAMNLQWEKERAAAGAGKKKPSKPSTKKKAKR